MRKLSKMVPRALLDRTERALYAHSVALMLSRRGRPDAVERVKLDGDTYVLELYGRARADGGVLVQTFKHKGQLDSIQAFYFEDYRADVARRAAHSRDALPFAIACGHLDLRTRLTLVPATGEPLCATP